MKMWKLIVALILVIAAIYIVPRIGKSTDKGEYGQAILEFIKTNEITPWDALGYNNRGFTYYSNGQYKRAIADYTKAIQFDADFGLAYINRGNVYYDTGEHDQAISDYTKALEINPRDAMAYKNRAHAYYLKREYDKAWEDVYKVQSLGLQVHPGFLKALREASGRESP